MRAGSRDWLRTSNFAKTVTRFPLATSVFLLPSSL